MTGCEPNVTLWASKLTKRKKVPLKSFEDLQLLLRGHLIILPFCCFPDLLTTSMAHQALEHFWRMLKDFMYVLYVVKSQFWPSTYSANNIHLIFWISEKWFIMALSKNITRAKNIYSFLYFNRFNLRCYGLYIKECLHWYLVGYHCGFIRYGHFYRLQFQAIFPFFCLLDKILHCRDAYIFFSLNS